MIGVNIFIPNPVNGITDMLWLLIVNASDISPLVEQTIVFSSFRTFQFLKYANVEIPGRGDSNEHSFETFLSKSLLQKMMAWLLTVILYAKIRPKPPRCTSQANNSYFQMSRLWYSCGQLPHWFWKWITFGNCYSALYTIRKRKHSFQESSWQLSLSNFTFTHPQPHKPDIPSQVNQTVLIWQRPFGTGWHWRVPIIHWKQPRVGSAIITYKVTSKAQG